MLSVSSGKISQSSPRREIEPRIRKNISPDSDINGKFPEQFSRNLSTHKEQKSQRVMAKIRSRKTLAEQIADLDDPTPKGLGCSV